VPARAADSHKGDFGRVLVMTGSVGMAGAPALVGLGALRGGAGLVTIAVPRAVQATVTALCPCATTIGLPETPDGQIDPEGARRVFLERGMLADSGRGLAPPDVLVTGPGVGRGSPVYGAAFWDLINAFRNGPLVPAVIDADALNLAKRATRQTPGGWDAQYHFRTVITPHPGEMARLHDASTGEVQADREGFAVRTARMMAAQRDEPDYTPVVVLKGAGTIVTDGNRIYVNDTGNPGMATGGSGDVLAGVIGALVGQGMEIFDAAVTGVYVHGLAGDIAARRLGEVSLIATDIIATLPEAFLRHVAKK
jgi:ADP-dependent NAD(P)H-hydrate dehydratase